MNSYESLLAKISLVRRRWRLQVMARGISLFLVCAVTLLVLGIWGADLFGFRPPAVWAMRLLTGSALVFVAWYFLYVPLRARLTDVRIARFVEESSPELQDRLVAAVEYGKTEGSSSSIIGLLIRDALDKTSHVDFSMFLNRRRLASFLVIGCSSLLVLLALLNWGPSFFSYGFGRLYVPWTEASRIAPMLIEIYPADIEIARGSDQQVEARLIGFDSPDVRLYVRPESSEMWDSSQMEADPRGSGFSYLLVDLKSSLRYYVGARGVRSRTGSIKSASPPRREATRYVNVRVFSSSSCRNSMRVRSSPPNAPRASSRSARPSRALRPLRPGTAGGAPRGSGARVEGEQDASDAVFVLEHQGADDAGRLDQSAELARTGGGHHGEHARAVLAHQPLHLAVEALGAVPADEQEAGHSRAAPGLAASVRHRQPARFTLERRVCRF